MNEKNYSVVRNQPVAKFFYKGRSHSHPVRRTVILIESTNRYLRGYELREGANARTFNKAPIKTYSKDRIAKIRELDARRILRAKAKSHELDNSTLYRSSIVDLVKTGI
jgi:hypothetical protein